MSPNPEQRERFAQRLREAGLDTQRFIQVHDGEKRSTNHTQYEPDDARIKGNYGVYPGEGAGDSGEGFLVNVDIDDYETDETDESLEAILSLPETLTVASPHTDGDTGGHRFYKVTGDLLERIEEIAGPGTTNLKLSWGEIRSDNQYVVGPGSQLHGCDKDWCDECAEHDGGYYDISNDVPIATVTADDLIDAVLVDPNYPKDAEETADEHDPEIETDFDLDIDVSARPGYEFTNLFGQTLDEIREDDEKLDDLLTDLNPVGYGYPSRSEADSAAAFKLVGKRFSAADAASILQTHRPYEKTFRKSALYPTLSKALRLAHREYVPPEDGRPATVLPPSVRELTDRPDITRQDHYDRVQKTITNAIRRNEDVLVDAIMGGGKTYGSFAAAKATDRPLFYAAPRIDLYEQGQDYAIENGFDEGEIKILPSMKRDCPTYRGEHGERWAAKVQRQYARGATPKGIHEFNDGIPCKHDDTDCPYERKWDFDPDDYRVIIGHYKHAHVPMVTKGRTLVFDEDPSSAYINRMAGSHLIGGVNAFLALDNSPPFDDFDDLVTNRNAERAETALEWYDEFDFEPDEQNVVRFEDEGFHAYAPHAVYTILKSKPIEEGYDFERANLPGMYSGGLFFTTSDEHDEYFVEIRTPPVLQYAQNVIALDGTPLIDKRQRNPHKAPEWSAAIGIPLHHRPVLSKTERASFIRDTLDLTYIQSSPHIKPYSSGEYATKVEDYALIESVRRMYCEDGDAPVVFTSKTVEEEYAELEDAGVVEAFDHPGNIRGTNEYAETRVAIQLGSSHHGDHEIRRRAAWMRESVFPSGKGVARDYGDGLGNEILFQMRENQTAQNVLRVGRDGEGAVVVIHTCAYPDYFEGVIFGTGTVEQWSPTMRAVHNVWTGAPKRTAGVADAIGDVSESAVRQALTRFVDLGYLVRRADPEDGRATLWVDDGLDSISPYGTGECELPGPDDLAERRRMYIYTRSWRKTPDGSVEIVDTWPSPVQTTLADEDNRGGSPSMVD